MRRNRLLNVIFVSWIYYYLSLLYQDQDNDFIEMAGEAAQALLTIRMMQSVFQSFDKATMFESFMCPVDTPIENITAIGSFDYIIVGAGTAGSVLANRLSGCPSASVLLIEAGECPPLESLFPAYFPYIPVTKNDYNIPAVNDNYSCQNLQGKSAKITIGKMLGGSSSLQHMIAVRGDASESYDRWVEATNDSAWSYDKLLPYFKRSEDVKDKEIIAKYGYYHGTKGNTILKRQLSPQNDGIIDSYHELGYKIRVDTNNYDPLGVVSPLLQISDKYRQDGVTSYLSPVKYRPNLYVLSKVTVTKVVFDNRNTATGVQIKYNGKSYEVNSVQEIILSAGAIKTPQLLMLSGVGPADHLKLMNIPVISDLPVGKNLQDHTSAIAIFSLENDTAPTPAVVPTEYPAPTTTNFVNLDNETAKVAQCQGINLVIPQKSPGLMALCLNAFKYNVDICQKWYDANNGKKVLFSFNTPFELLSKGYVLLKTKEINDDPIVNVGYLSEKSDLQKLGRCLAYTGKLVGTTYFKMIGAEFKDLGLCSDEKGNNTAFWECYGRAMSTPSWHFCGTAAMGSVVDSYLRVKGVKGLRIVDASVIPSLPNAKLNGPVLVVAEKGAALILSSNKKCSSKKHVPKCH